jgi:hypothetical protein
VGLHEYQPGGGRCIVSLFLGRTLLSARGAYREAARMYPDELIQLRQGARVIEKSK